MRIGIDVDGSIIEIIRTMGKVLQKYEGIKIPSYEETYDYNLCLVWKCSEKEMKRRVNVLYHSDEFAALDPEPEVSTALRRLFLRNEGFPLTARPDYVEHITQAMFARAGVEFPNSYHLGHYHGNVSDVTKVDIALSLPSDGKPLDVVVEDALHEAEAIAAAGIPVLFVNRPWNEGIAVSTGITRVDPQWRQVIEYVESYKK